MSKPLIFGIIAGASVILILIVVLILFLAFSGTDSNAPMVDIEMSITQTEVAQDETFYLIVEITNNGDQELPYGKYRFDLDAALKTEMDSGTYTVIESELDQTEEIVEAITVEPGETKTVEIPFEFGHWDDPGDYVIKFELTEILSEDEHTTRTRAVQSASVMITVI